MRKIRLKKHKNIVDNKLVIITLALTLIGVISVADASAPSAISNFSDKFYFAKQQALWGVLGVALLIIVSKINYKYWEKIAVPLFIASVGLLILVLIPGFSRSTLGAKRWIYIGPVSFQPSEFIKLTLAVYLAKVASKGKKPLSFFLPLIIVALPIIIQPDLGTAIVVVGIGLAQIFMSGLNLLYFLSAAMVGVSATILLILTSPYRKDRLITYFQQSQDPLGKSYHIRQILLALGAGGLFGVGLGQSRQKYLFLPEAATDSIFAVIAEEVGFIGSLLLIFLFALFIYRGLIIIKYAPDTFSKILATGIVSWIGGQAFVNIASMLAIVPLTGIPLPFISYGGSSLTTTLLSTGILLNISRYEEKSRKK